MIHILGCSLLLIVGLLTGGCQTGEQSAASSGAPADSQPGALAASTVPPPGAVLPATGGPQPFRATGRLVLNGNPPFAQPVLILDDGATYQLTGPGRGQCVRCVGRRVDLSGVRVGTSSAPGVRGVVRVTGFREVER